jgi:hypothetical protein
MGEGANIETRTEAPVHGRLVPTGVYRRGRTFWIRYHGPRRNGTWGQICESAKTSDPEAARRLREVRLQEVADHREGNHLFRGPYQGRTPVPL